MKGIHDPAAVEACLRACRFGKVLEAQRTELFLLECEKGELVTAPPFRGKALSGGGPWLPGHLLHPG